MNCKRCKRTIPQHSIFCNWCGTRQIVEEDGGGGVKFPKAVKTKTGYTGQIMVNGKRIRITERTEEEYNQKAKALKNGDNLYLTMTLADAIISYDSERASMLEPRTIEMHEYIARNRFSDLMQMRCLDIKQADIDRAVEQELRKPSRKGGTISAKTVNDALAVVIQVLKQAAGVDVTAKFAKERKKLHDYPTVEDVINAVIGTDIELPCLLALWLGMSMEEIRGLTKSRSIRGNRLVVVEKIVDTKNGAIRLDGGKAYDRVRSFEMPDYIRHMIDASGEIIEPRSSHAIYMRLQKELERHGVKRCSFHDLRHLNTATMTSGNIPSKTIQQRNGWSSDRMIKEVYDYVYDEDRKKADAYMDSTFEKLIKNQQRSGEEEP